MLALDADRARAKPREQAQPPMVARYHDRGGTSHRKQPRDRICHRESRRSSAEPKHVRTPDNFATADSTNVGIAGP
jgi:hypothetical protein